MAPTSPRPISIWWRGKVRLEKDQIIPVERQPYNPFEYFFPAGLRNPKDEGTRSLPYLFLQVDAAAPRAVLTFCEQYGVLGDASQEGWRPWAQEIYTVAFSDIERRVIKTLKPEIHQGIAGIPAIRSLARPMPLAAFRRAQSELQQTLEWMRAFQEGEQGREGLGASGTLRRRIAEKLSMVRPYADWNAERQKWTTGWDAGSLESLLYLMLLYDCQGKGRIAECPNCKNAFMADKPKMKYCSGGCGGNFRVKKHRERNRRKMKSRKEKR